MKQVEKTPDIVAKLQKAVGDGVDTSNLAVFEAIGLNSLPIRKKHPLYLGSRFDAAFLAEMAQELEIESRPIYLMHDRDAPTPVGRAFYGEVRDNFGVSELRTLFFIDKVAHPDLVGKLDNGTVDQVSVSVLAKKMVCSSCDFDYLSPEADYFENILAGTCDEGHVIGQNGVYAAPKGLDSFFEMSLVGRGGARNARIVNRDEQVIGSTTFQRLAASGVDPSIFTLVASAENIKMDLTQLITDLTDKKAELSAANVKVTDLTAQLTAAQAQVVDLTGQLTVAPKQVDFDAAVTALRDVTKKVLVASGKVDAKTDDMDVATCVSTITETSSTLVAKLAAGGKSKDATTDAEVKPSGVFSKAFRIAR